MLNLERCQISCPRCGSKEFGLEQVTYQYVPDNEKPQHFDTATNIQIYCKNCDKQYVMS